MGAEAPATRLCARSYDPSPVRKTFCGLPPPSSLMLTPSLRVPVAAVLNVTVMAQLAPPALLVPQGLVWGKSPAFVPVPLIPVKFKGALHTFVTLTFLVALVVPT